MTAAARLLVVVVLALLPSCATPGGGGGGAVARIVDCASKAIQQSGLRYVGKVNDIIGSTGISDQEAHARLIDLGIDAGQDVLGCLLRDQGTKFGESARRNPNDQVSATAARRADKRLGELVAEGWAFR